MPNITQVAPTVARLLGIEYEGEPNKAVLDFIGRGTNRVLLYNPDAIAWWIYEKYCSFFDEIRKTSPFIERTESVMPSVTPVCFASMYTGLMPEFHGIQAYVKPILTCRTLFDALIENGMHPAICSTEGDSISKIFLNRNMEYYLFPTIDEVNAKAKELIAKDKNELIVVYNGNYDAAMHKVSPEGEAALAALRENVAVYTELRTLCKSANPEYVTAFLPDHGCHEIDGGMGSHGLLMDEDMYVVHVWG